MHFNAITGAAKIRISPRHTELRIKHYKVFSEIPPGRPPNRGIEHIIELEEGAKPIIITPYRHTKRLTDEIEKPSRNYLLWGTLDQVSFLSLL